MRSPSEIRHQVLLIRDKNHVSVTEIAKDSRCSESEIYASFRFEASEATLRKLDAYLDAPKLHTKRSGSRIMWEYEQISYELWKEYGFSCAHPRKVQGFSEDRKKRYISAYHYKAKCFLVQMMYVETGLNFRIPDSGTYWEFKARCLKRAQAVRSKDGHPYYFPRPSPVGAKREVVPDKDPDRLP